MKLPKHWKCFNRVALERGNKVFSENQSKLGFFVIEASSQNCFLNLLEPLVRLKTIK
jgi:hypothetical protein